MENVKLEKATINIKSDTLASTLKAVKPFASKDPTRVSLHQVCVEREAGSDSDVNSKIKVTATDGHTLCSVTVDCLAGDHTLANGGARYVLTPSEIDVILARCKAGKDGRITIEVAPENPDMRFPPYEHVIPAIETLQPKFEAIGFNAKYLARLGDVQKLLDAKACVARFGDALGPARFDIDGFQIGAQAIVVIMPMRI